MLYSHLLVMWLIFLDARCRARHTIPATDVESLFAQSGGRLIELATLLLQLIPSCTSRGAPSVGDVHHSIVEWRSWRVPFRSSLIEVGITDHEEGYRSEEGAQIVGNITGRESSSGFQPELEIGNVYRNGKIVGIHRHGVHVEVTPGHQVLLPLARISSEPLKTMAGVDVKVGDLIDVKVTGRDDEGRFILSRFPEPEVGKVYCDRKIVSVVDYGVFVDVTPGHKGLLPLLRITKRGKSAEEAGLKKGDLIDVIVESRDEEGRVELSRFPIPEIGKTYRNCRIHSVASYGVFVEVTPGYTALLPLRKVSGLLESIEEAGLKKGDLIDVKVERRDEKGRMELSRFPIPEIGKTYRNCSILSVASYGVFVEVTPGYTELLPLRKVSGLLESIEEAGLKKGDLIDVTVAGRNSEGRLDLVRFPAPEIGKVYRDCKIVHVASNGVFVEVTPGHGEYLRNERIARSRLQSIGESGFQKGELIDVKVEGLDTKGSFFLTHLDYLSEIEDGAPGAQRSSLPEVGKVYRDCKVVSIVSYGIYVEVTPGHSALLHISDIFSRRLESIEDSGFKEGNFIDVRVTGRDKKGALVLKRFPEPEIGNVYRNCKILSIHKYGFVVEVTPAHSLLLPISKIASGFLASIEDAGFKVDDFIDVKVTTDRNGGLVLNRFPVPKVGKVYRDCKIIQVSKYGLFVDVTPGHKELLRIDQISNKPLKSIEEAGFKKGDLIDVKVESQDAEGRVTLSRLDIHGEETIDGTPALKPSLVPEVLD